MSIAKNVALSNYIIYMVDSASRPDGKTGETVVVTISKDGAAFGSATNTPATEVANGFYKIDLTQAEMNADSIAIRATAGSSDDWNDAFYPDDIEAVIAVVDGNVDDIETLLNTVDGKVDTLDTNVDSLVTSFSPVFGAGTIETSHDVAKGSDVDLTILDAGSSPVEDANVYIFLKTDYDAENRSSSFYKGYVTSDVNGEWDYSVYLDAGTYTLVADGAGISQVMVQEFTVS